MIVTCTIEEADRCGICDDDVTGLHAVFCRDGRVVFVLCVECLGLAVASRAQREVKRKAALEDLFTAVESYRVAIGPLLTRDGKIAICAIQWFDEFGYDQLLFLTEEKFPTEEAARSWCLANEHVYRERLRQQRIFEEG